MKKEAYPFSKDFTFCAVLRRNKNLCIRLVEIILDTKVLDIEYIGTQQTIDLNPDQKGIRLDVYVDDGQGTVYDLEMQTTVSDELPKRVRYYQGAIDLGLIEKGEHYTKLKKSVIIFICTADPFGCGLSRYTFARVCREKPELILQDETLMIFLNSEGERNGIGTELAEFLNYVETNRPTDAFTRDLEHAVQDVNRDTEWRRTVMTLEMKYLDYQYKGIKQGLEQGRTEGRMEMLIELIKGNIISISEAAKTCGMTEKELERLLREKDPQR